MSWHVIAYTPGAGFLPAWSSISDSVVRRALSDRAICNAAIAALLPEGVACEGFTLSQFDDINAFNAAIRSVYGRAPEDAGSAPIVVFGRRPQDATRGIIDTFEGLFTKVIAAEQAANSSSGGTTSLILNPNLTRLFPTLIPSVIVNAIRPGSGSSTTPGTGAGGGSSGSGGSPGGGSTPAAPRVNNTPEWPERVVQLFSSPACGACRSAAAWLTAQGVPFTRTEITSTSDATLVNAFRSIGMSPPMGGSTPIIIHTKGNPRVSTGFSAEDLTARYVRGLTPGAGDGATPDTTTIPGTDIPEIPTVATVKDSFGIPLLLGLATTSAALYFWRKIRKP